MIFPTSEHGNSILLIRGGGGGRLKNCSCSWPLSFSLPAPVLSPPPCHPQQQIPLVPTSDYIRIWLLLPHVSKPPRPSPGSSPTSLLTCTCNPLSSFLNLKCALDSISLVPFHDGPRSPSWASPGPSLISSLAPFPHHWGPATVDVPVPLKEASTILP